MNDAKVKASRRSEAEKLGSALKAAGWKINCQNSMHIEAVLEGVYVLGWDDGAGAVDWGVVHGGKGFKPILQGVTTAAEAEKQILPFHAEAKAIFKRKRRLRDKYVVQKNGVEITSPFFVLRPDRDYAARVALQVYADAVEANNSDLADDLRKWLSLMESKEGG